MVMMGGAVFTLSQSGFRDDFSSDGYDGRSSVHSVSVRVPGWLQLWWLWWEEQCSLCLSPGSRMNSALMVMMGGAVFTLSQSGFRDDFSSDGYDGRSSVHSVSVRVPGWLQLWWLWWEEQCSLCLSPGSGMTSALMVMMGGAVFTLSQSGFQGDFRSDGYDGRSGVHSVSVRVPGWIQLWWLWWEEWWSLCLSPGSRVNSALMVMMGGAVFTLSQSGFQDDKNFIPVPLSCLFCLFWNYTAIPSSRDR